MEIGYLINTIIVVGNAMQFQFDSVHYKLNERERERGGKTRTWQIKYTPQTINHNKNECYGNKFNTYTRYKYDVSYWRARKKKSENNGNSM